MEKVFIVFGYNNVRLFDVKKIQKIAKEQYSAKLMLCREIITQEDKDNMDYTLLVDLKQQDSESLKQQVKQVFNYIQQQHLEVIGCLPFSDKGIQLGNIVARDLNLFHDELGELALACIDKVVFRRLERKQNLPNWYKQVDFQVAYTAKDLYNFFHKYPKFFLKPIAEGGSRGCMAINSEKDIDYWANTYGAILNQGALCEEYIENIGEYSYDRVGNYEWITEKLTTLGRFRAEPNHSVPAPLAKNKYELLLEAGRLVSKMVGSNGGACHMELFLTDNNQVASVEPNRRPAGANIFEMGNLVYTELTNSWEEWLKIANGGEINPACCMKKGVFAVNRLVSPISSGVVGKIDTNKLHTLLLNSYPDSLISLQMITKEGDKISPQITDNSGFLGMFVTKGDTYQNANEIANKIENMVADYVEKSNK